MKVFPEIDEEIKTLRNSPKLLNDNKDNKNLINVSKNNSQSLLEHSQQKEESGIEILKPLETEISKISFDYEQEKQKYDNLILDKDIQIEKQNFEGGYHEIIFLKSIPYDQSKKIKYFDQIPNFPKNFPFELDEFQKNQFYILKTKKVS